MLICAMELTIHLPDAASLKEKRQVAKSLIARLQRRFGLSAAEVDRQDVHQEMVIGFACVSNRASHAEEMVDKVIDFLEKNTVQIH